ncbi:DUF1330 domain-containing protein [Erythrobacter sp.]|uniref:DUF1330 domain-containing protein n=1 Tax=Erythrobacter sp. TaxID=1042 RepID=UPI002EA377D6|nr:DUF1330 domain-containing protein [Erythrobacter sp.]
MPAYMIILCKLHEREKFISGYGKAVPPLVAKYGGEYVVVAPGAELLEGNLEGYGSVAVSKWPNKAAARRFWDSADYAEAKKLREGLADAEVLLVEAP